MNEAIRRFRIWRATRRLEKLIRARRKSFEVQDYAKRRAAALKHTRNFATANRT